MEEHAAMMLCGREQKHFIVHAKFSDAVSRNAISVKLQIRASDLSAQHQRLLTAKCAPNKPDSNRLTNSQELIASAQPYNTVSAP